MPVEPKHSFFNWLYICSLLQKEGDIFEKLERYDGFSDIFYSPRKDPIVKPEPPQSMYLWLEKG